MLQRPAVKWPDASWELLSWTKLLTIDVEFMKPDCVVPLPFFTKWIGKFCMPFGLIILVCLVTCVLARKVKIQQRNEEDINRGQSFWGIEQNGGSQNKASIWGVLRFTLALIIHVILIWHLKVVLSPVDCNWCREGVTCLDEYTLVECWGDNPTWIRMMIISSIDLVFISGFFPIFLMCNIFWSWQKDKKLSKEQVKEANKGPTFTSFFVGSSRPSKDSSRGGPCSASPTPGNPSTP